MQSDYVHNMHSTQILPVNLYIVDYDECDSKKCTAKKIARFGFAKIMKFNMLPPNALLLDPTSEKAFSIADLKIAQSKGLVVIDCSWRTAEDTFRAIKHRFERRALPFLIAANPVHFGKAALLSTAEAFAAALFIFGYKECALRILSLFKWGLQFFNLNEGYLTKYALAKNSTEIVSVQNAILQSYAKTYKVENTFINHI
jgi:pre-rRNA-processing protein TSR3